MITQFMYLPAAKTKAHVNDNKSTSAKASVDKLTNITLQVHKDVDLLGNQFIFVIYVNKVEGLTDQL